MKHICDTRVWLFMRPCLQFDAQDQVKGQADCVWFCLLQIENIKEQIQYLGLHVGVELKSLVLIRGRVKYTHNHNWQKNYPQIMGVCFVNWLNRSTHTHRHLPPPPSPLIPYPMFGDTEFETVNIWIIDNIIEERHLEVPLGSPQVLNYTAEYCYLFASSDGDVLWEQDLFKIGQKQLCPHLYWPPFPKQWCFILLFNGFSLMTG